MGVARLESVKKHGHGMFALFAALFMRPIWTLGWNFENYPDGN